MEATVTAICYKAKILKDGTSPVMVRICKDGKRKYKSLGIAIHPKFWNFRSNLLKGSCPDYERLQLIINEEVGKIKRAILDNRIAGKEFTATTLLSATEKKQQKITTVGESYLQYIQSLKSENRIRYAGMYEVSYNSFIKFNGHLDIPFADVDNAWLKRYEKWMKSQNYAINTIGTRVRHLRTIFNQAIDMKLIPTDVYPFRTYKVSKMNQQTAKRALIKEDILNIIQRRGKSEMETLAIDYMYL